MSASRVVWFFVGSLLAMSAQAYIDPPVLLPPEPTDVDELIVEITAGQCDILETSDPDWAVVTVDGNTITLRVDGVRHTDPLWCFFPVLTNSVPIGTYPAGDYTLVAQFRYDSFFGPPPVIEEIGRLDFTVAGTQPPASAHPVPIGTPLAWLVLGGGVVYLAWRRRGRRQAR